MFDSVFLNSWVALFFFFFFLKVIFIESICHDQDLVLRNIMAVRESSPEYHDLSPEESERDFRARIKIYERLYQVWCSYS